MKTWTSELHAIKHSEAFQQTIRFVEQQRKSGKVIYPPTSQVFNAFKLTAFSDVKVVILGQDPYHGVGQANGLAFSVNPDIRIPPSLVNIYKELAADLSIPPPQNGDLTHWAKQGVLLLNTVLTVENGKANAHRNQGWETFTDAVIQSLNQAEQHIVFLLWGRPAHSKIPLIDADKHTILTAPHPSPLSAYRGFFGCKHFSQANAALAKHQQSPIQW